jgi:YD repeat-containing protein
MTTPAGLVTRTRYDAAGRVVATVGPQDWITRYEYNASGQQTAMISPSGAVTRYRYDLAGQQTEVIDPNGSPSRFGYDEAGRIVAITDAKGSVTRFSYDAAGRLTERTDPLGRATRRAYDAAGNLITLTDPSGRAQHFSYDADGRTTLRRADDGTEVSFTYDPAGRRTAMTDATGTTRYAYDSTGRITAVTDPDGGVVATAYDAAGQRSSLTYPGGHRVTYDYDPNGRLTALRDPRAGTAVYALDRDGRLLTEQLPGRFARRYRYERGQLARFSVVYDGHPVAKAYLTYDPDGRIATTREDDLVTRYRYDPAGQLTDVLRYRNGTPRPERPGQRGELGARDLHLTYDVVGNRMSLRHGERETHYDYDPASQLRQAETAGRRTEFGYDTSGRLTEERQGDLRRVIEYDGFGRPASITRRLPGHREQAREVFSGDGLLTVLTMTSTVTDREEERSALVRYRWSNDTIPQILTQRAEPRTSDAERDRPGRLDADFSYGYGRTFADWDGDGEALHTDLFGTDLRTEDTQAWVQAEHYDTFGAPELPPPAQAPALPNCPGSATGASSRLARPFTCVPAATTRISGGLPPAIPSPKASRRWLRPSARTPTRPTTPSTARIR